MLLLFASLFVATVSKDAKETKPDVAATVRAYESATIRWIAALGTPREKALQQTVYHLRMKIVAFGVPSIRHLPPLLEHKHVNVRRGAAVALDQIVRKYHVKDPKLLDSALLRMVKDDDIKVRSNLYHAASAIIANIRKPVKKPVP